MNAASFASRSLSITAASASTSPARFLSASVYSDTCRRAGGTQVAGLYDGSNAALKR